MPDYKKPDDRPDRFSEAVGRRLDECRLAPGEEVWPAIEAALARRRSGRRLVWLAAAVAAAAFLAVFLLGRSFSGKELPAGGYAFERKEAPPALHLAEPPEATLAPRTLARAAAKDTAAARDTVSRRDTVTAEPPEPSAEPAEKQPGEQPEPEQKGAPRQTPPADPYRHLAYASRPARKGQWQVAAGFGAGGSFPSLSIGGDRLVYDNAPSGGSSGIPSIPSTPSNEYNQALSPDDFTDTKHRLPLSFGLTVRKHLNRTLAVETGVVYTRLSTDFERMGKIHYDANLKLHYLGVPVNLVVKLWDRPLWTVYLSGGGMVEKGLRSVYHQRQFLGDKVNHLDVKGSIRGLQWSLNGSVGVAYRFHDDFSLYVEPRISYYFDTDQPFSLRTEHPTSFGLGAGIRYEF